MRCAALVLVLCLAAAGRAERSGPDPQRPLAAELLFSLLAVGDTGEPPPLLPFLHTQRAVGLGLAAEDRRQPADALVLLGDNFYPDGLERRDMVSRLRENLVAPYCRFVDLSAPRSGLVRNACSLSPSERHPIPIYAVLGNHDYDDPESPSLQRDAVPGFVANWHVPGGVAEAVDLPQGVSLVLADAIALESAEDPTALGEALRQARGPWRILVIHRPIAETRESRGERSRRRFDAYRARVLGQLADSGATVHLVLSGDEHNLQVIAMPPPAPPLQIVAGSGSSTKPYASNPDARFQLQAPGFARVDLVSRGPSQRLRVSLFHTRGHTLFGSAPRLVSRWEVAADATLPEIAATAPPEAGD